MRIFIGNKMVYPEKAKETGLEGTVLVRYAVNYKGQVVDAKIVSGLGLGCDEEALRLVKLLKFHVNKSYKVRVLFYKKIQIHFNLPKPLRKKMKIQYASSDREKVKKDSGSSSYFYSINIPEA